MRPAILLFLLFLGLSTQAQVNEIDRLTEIRQNHAKNKIPWPLLEDGPFLRRVWIDLTGSVPDWEVIEEWRAKPHPWDRGDIVNQALGTRSFDYRWAHWLLDTLGIKPLATQFAFAEYSYFGTMADRVAENQTWDRIVTDALTYSGPSDEETGMLAFIISNYGDQLSWLDAMDDQVANISDKLLGIEMRCISCHDGAYHLEEVNTYLSERTREEFWGMAAFFASAAPYCPTRCDRKQPAAFFDGHYGDLDGGTIPNANRVWLPYKGDFHNGQYMAQSEAGDDMRPARRGGIIRPSYMFSGERPGPNESRRQAFARMLTNDRQFARNMTNRIWKHFFGQGFVEPVNSFDLNRLDAETAAAKGTTVQPTDPELMELMTDTFIESGFDMRALIHQICTSELYQLDLEALPEYANTWNSPYLGGKLRYRRLEAQTIVESVSNATGIRPGIGNDEGNLWDLFSSQQPYLDTFPMAELLNALGRGDRRLEEPAKATFDQNAALALLNSQILMLTYFGQSPIFAELTDAINRGQMEPSEAVTRVFLSMLLREPNEAEMAAALKQWQAYPGNRSLRDMAWSLLNSPEFLYR